MSLDPSTAPQSRVLRLGEPPIFAKTKAIFFDLDDTLCAYWNAAKTGLRMAFESNPVPGATVEQLIGHWGDAFRDFAPTIKDTKWYGKYLESGETTRAELMRRTLERVSVFDNDLADRLSHTYYVERLAALELFPESLEVLDQLRPNYALGLITNGPADIQRQELEKLRIGEYFSTVLIEGEVGKGKPDPFVMEEAERLCGHKGDEVLFIGNSFHHDVVPARQAGWRQAWVRRPSDVPPTSKTSVPEPLPEGAPPPDLTITDLRELLPALGLA